MRRRTRLPLIGAVVVAMGMAFAPSAAADFSTPRPIPTTPTITTATPFAVVPPVGQIVTVQGPDALAVYYSVSAACEQQMNVYPPEMSGGYVWAEYSVSVSSGCLAGVAEFYLQKTTAFGWSTQADSGLIGLQPGEALISTVTAKCTNTKSTTWRIAGQWNGTGSMFTAGPATYSCGT